MSTRRAVIGAVLLDLAVSPLFAWDAFAASLRDELRVGDTALAGVFSVGLMAFMVAVLVGGRVADAVSPRLLVLLTAAGAVAGLVGSAAATSVAAMMLSFGVLLGGATGIGYVTAVRVAATAARRGLALGLVVSAYAAGSAVLAPVAGALLTVVGRGATFVLLAGALGGVLVVAAVLVPGRPAAQWRVTGRRARTRWWCPSRPVVALWMAFGLGSAPALAAFAQAGALAGTPSVAALAVAVLNAGNFAGRLVAGPLSDRVGRAAGLLAASVVLLLACLPLAVGAHGTVALVALGLLGTQYGALSALIPLATSDVVPREVFGTTYGLVFTGWGIAGLLAPVAAAALAEQVGYGGVYQVFLAAAVLSVVCVATYARLIRDHPGTGDAGG